MECEHGLEFDPVTQGHITASGVGWFKVEHCHNEPKGSTIPRCQHGVYDPSLTGVAENCQMCNHRLNRVIGRVRPRRELNSDAPKRNVMDAAQFTALPVGVRMATFSFGDE